MDDAIASTTSTSALTYKVLQMHTSTVAPSKHPFLIGMLVLADIDKRRVNHFLSKVKTMEAKSKVLRI